MQIKYPLDVHHSVLNAVMHRLYLFFIFSVPFLTHAALFAPTRHKYRRCITECDVALARKAPRVQEEQSSNSTVVVCCGVLRCDAVWCGVMRCDAVCCSALQRVAVRCSALQCQQVYFLLVASVFEWLWHILVYCLFMNDPFLSFIHSILSLLFVSLLSHQ